VQHQATHARNDDGEANRVSPPLKRIATAWRSLPGLRGGIGLRLLVRVLLFSLLITLLLTLMQLYLDYRRDVGAIDQRLSEIDSGYRRSLGEGLWRLDARQLQLQAEGILHLPDVSYVELREATDRAAPLVVTAGSSEANPALRREFKIYYTNHGVEQLVGILVVEATFDRIYRQLFDTAAVILVGQAIMTFIVSFFILLVVHRLITRHLTGIATSLREYDLHGSQAPLQLERRRPGDELDHLVDAFNGMYARLQTAYGDLAEREKHLTATSEVLRTISNAPSDLRSALDAVAEYAARLCNASNARIWRLEDNVLRLVATYGESSATMDGREGLPADRDTVTGRAACDRRTIHVHDIAAEDREYPLGSRIVKGQGWHTTLATPLLREGAPVGTILVRRMEVRPFDDQQIALLETFADQAAIAIENVRLFEAEKQRTLALAHANRDLAEREAKIRRLVDSNIIGIFVWDFDGRVLEANDEFLHMLNYDREDLVAGHIAWADLTPPDWRDRNDARIEQQKGSGRFAPFEKEYTRKDGRRVPILIGGATFAEGGNQGVAFVLDLTERKRGEERLRVQHTAAQILAEAATIEEAAPKILSAMGECLGWDVGVLWRVDREGEALHCVELWHKASMVVPEFEKASRETTFVPGLGLPGRVWSSLEPEYVPDVVPDKNFPRGPVAEREGLHAAFGFPILLGGEALGVIEFFSREIRQPDQELLNVLATIGSQVGQFIERKRAEQALRDSERSLRSAIDGIAGLVAIMAPNGELDALNRQVTDYFGRSLEEMKNWGTSDAIHPEDLPRIAEIFQRSVAAGTPFSYELRLRRFDGEYRWFDNRCVPIREKSGRIVRWYMLGTDIEQRKLAEDALRESEAKFRDYAATASDWFWETDPDHKFARVTDYERRLALGFAPVSRIGLARWEFATDVESEPEKWKLHRSTLEARQPFRNFAYRSTRRDGSPVYYEISGKPVYDAKGGFLGYRGTGTDVTALLTAEAEARESERRYREVQLELAHANRVATMGQLSASITHEVNQPITAAITYALAARRWLNAEPPNSREVDDALSLIVKEGNRASEVIARIHALIKKTPARKDAVAINDAILEIIALTRTEAANNCVSVRTQLAENLPRVQGDRVQLQQVLLNLIINAIEAMRDVGEAERELLVSTRNEPDGVSVEVRDSGPGFAPAAIERVFDAFYTTKPSGLGLGLSICRSIIEAHGGRLRASPNVPRGAVFRFTAPAHPAETS
jgi:PAS domain S-box-containing protein